MRLISIVLVGLTSLVAVAAVAEDEAAEVVSPPTIAECAPPDAPVMPDGNTAPASDLKAASADVKAFLAAGEVYTACLDEHKLALGEEVTDEEDAALITAYNAMVDQMTAVAGEFNAALSAYKAKRAAASAE
jgi:hypothetical protein